MLTLSFALAICLPCQIKIAPPHDQNSVFVHVIEKGIDVNGRTITLPPPRLVDAAGPDDERTALEKIAGSNQAVEELLRDSVTAPFIIKVHDTKVAGATVRQADLWFAVHGDLKSIDPASEAARTDQKAVEVANMWFQTRLLNADEIRAVGVKLADQTGSKSWFAHIHAKLLDRIDFEVTNHIVASQSPQSIVIASATDPSFTSAGSLSNGWKSLKTTGPAEAREPPRQPYSGGISYAQISRVAFDPDVLLIEMHVAFIEPDGWFQGAPILRSKFSVAAQDQIRTLRRELAKKRSR